MTSLIGIITRETYLFNDTMRTNLLYGKPDATQSEIEEAAKAANIHDFTLDVLYNMTLLTASAVTDLAAGKNNDRFRPHYLERPSYSATG